MKAYLDYIESDKPIRYWRTTTGLEVDFLLGDAEIAIEVKFSDEVRFTQIRGLRAFKEERPNVRAYVVSMDKEPR